MAQDDVFDIEIDEEKSAADEGERRIVFQFQPQYGATRPAAKYVVGLLKPRWTYGVIVASRAVAMGLVIMAALALIPGAKVWQAALLVVLASLSSYVAVAIQVRAMRRLEKANALDPAFVGVQTVEVSRYGIRWQDDTTLTYLSWQAISEVTVVDGALLFRSGDVATYCIPARVFDGTGEADTILNTIKTMQADAAPPAHLEEELGSATRH